jgi:integrase
MVETRDINSMTADKMHKGPERLKVLSNKIKAIKTKDSLIKLYLEFADYQNTLVPSNKTALSAKTSIQHAGYFIDFYKASGKKFKKIDVTSKKFEDFISSYWDNICIRQKIHRNYSKKKLLPAKLSKNGIEKSGQQLRLFLKFVKFRTQKETKNLPLTKFDYNIVHLPDNIRPLFNNPLNTKNKFVGTANPISLNDFKRFIDFLSPSNKLDIELAAILVMISENGYRWSELLSTKIKNLKYEHGMHILEMEHAKTFLRTTILIYSWPYLDRWMNNHYDPNNEEAYLFSTKSGAPTEYANIRKLFIQRLEEFNKKNKDKLVFPLGQKFHLLRHYTGTRFIGWPSGLRDFYLGWITKGQFGKTYLERDYVELLRKCKKQLDQTYIEEDNPFIAAPPTNKIKELTKQENDASLEALKKFIINRGSNELLKLFEEADRHERNVK